MGRLWQGPDQHHLRRRTCSVICDMTDPPLPTRQRLPFTNARRTTDNTAESGLGCRSLRGSAAFIDGHGVQDLHYYETIQLLGTGSILHLHLANRPMDLQQLGLVASGLLLVPADVLLFRR